MTGATDTSEKGLEALIVAAMTGQRASAPLPGGAMREPEAAYGNWQLGQAGDYDRDYVVDLAPPPATQPKAASSLTLEGDEA